MIKIISMILLFAAPAMSCPDLSGVYDCKDEAGMTIFQTIENGYTVYTLEAEDSENTQKLITDGVERLMSEDDYGDMYMSVTCNGNAVVNKIRGTVGKKTAGPGVYTGETVTTKTNGVFRNVGKIDMIVDGQTFSHEINETCTEL